MAGATEKTGLRGSKTPENQYFTLFLLLYFILLKLKLQLNIFEFLVRFHVFCSSDFHAWKYI